MPIGGARARSGPPPDPNALKRDRPSDAATWTDLPAVRLAPAPAWPLPVAASDHEAAMWARLWALPQAVQWERLGLMPEVALHVRTLLAAGERSARSDVRALALRQMESLGLTAGGLARLRWRIGTTTTTTEAKRTDGSRRASASERLALLQGGKPPGA